MERYFWLLSGINGFAAVALGAFGAHGLERWLSATDDVSRRLGWWHTASHYHLIHALAIAAAAYLVQKDPRVASVAGVCFQLGILLFSGSLYLMTLSGIRWLGAITPIGGLLLLLGWAAVALSGFRVGG